MACFRQLHAACDNRFLYTEEATPLVWRVVEVLVGLFSIGMGLLNKKFTPVGWTTMLIWGRGENARIPRWLAGSFYFALGLLLLYIGITGKWQ
jgi:hypothetical protein